MPSLFDPIQLGAIAAPNRILMAPLTRGRATREHVPTPIMADYYAPARRRRADHHRSDRASAARAWAGPSRRACGPTSRPRPGSRSPRRCTTPAGGSSRSSGTWAGIVHPIVDRRRSRVSSSATTAPGQAHTYDGKQPYDEARPLALDEIPRLLDDYERATRNALAAGFDGVQLHAANGYLIDQFLRDGANFRDDAMAARSRTASACCAK